MFIRVTGLQYARIYFIGLLTYLPLEYRLPNTIRFYSDKFYKFSVLLLLYKILILSSFFMPVMRESNSIYILHTRNTVCIKTKDTERLLTSSGVGYNYFLSRSSTMVANGFSRKIASFSIPQT